MIEDKKSSSNYNERAKEIRNLNKEGWVSSVKISRMEEFRNILPRKMIKLCEKSDKFHALRIDVNGSKKYWYKKNDLEEIKLELEK